MHTPIPRPNTKFIFGHSHLIEPQTPVQSFTRMLLNHGPIIELVLPVPPENGRAILIGSHALAHELSDTTRFDKCVHKTLENIRDFAGDGLFTAHTEEPNWKKAHNILMPAFGPLAIRGMFPQMTHIKDQMLTRWTHFGEDTPFDVADHMTRLTLDTIALCAFDFRFNSFYQQELHPLVDAMVHALSTAGDGGKKKGLFSQGHNRRYQSHIDTLTRIADEIIQKRKSDPKGHEKQDLLSRLLSGRDPETGLGLSEENIRHQLVTFLIAGHETTSGLLAFAIHFLLEHPEVVQQARAEIEREVGPRNIEVQDLPRLQYTDSILRETLRLWPTAPVFGLRARNTTLIGGKHQITPQDTLLVVLPAVHRDPSVWGDDVEAFKPERFMPGQRENIPPDAWKPFGNGQRACIGQAFAMQEAVLVLASIIQGFDLQKVDPNRPLKVKETLTLKPEGLLVRAKRREQGPLATTAHPVREKEGASVSKTPLQGLLVLFGSQSGASESLARTIATEAQRRGCPVTVQSLNERTGNLPRGTKVVLVTSSYSGEAPTNAREFVDWSETLKPEELNGVEYTVFGCGNRDWHLTYQAVPKRIDTHLSRAGAIPFHPRGEADARGDFLGDFERWHDSLWQVLSNQSGNQNTSKPTVLQADVQRSPRASRLVQEGWGHAVVLENRELVKPPSARSKRHLTLQLPDGMTYQTGDHLAIMPTNPPATVQRALNRFQLMPDDLVTVTGTTLAGLPEGIPLAAAELLGGFVELSQTATRKALGTLIQATRCPPEHMKLQHLLDTFENSVLEKRLSVLDLLEQTPGCELGFPEFLGLLPALKPRTYSISSSPLVQENQCTLTVAVVDAPARSGHGTFLGTASTHLQNAKPGTRIPVQVRPAEHFRPPTSPETPLVLVCAGTGIAPFRGFVQERVLLQSRGQQVGETLLFVGFDHPQVDALYHEEWANWEAKGKVQVRPAYSATGNELPFVQHRLWQDRADIVRLFEQGASIYLCGDGQRMAPAVRETFIRMHQEETQSSWEEALSWAEQFERSSGRFRADVFA